MTRNEGTADRVIRVLVGLLLLSLVLLQPPIWWGLLGLIPLATGLIGWCPIYQLLGINTCPTKRH